MEPVNLDFCAPFDRLDLRFFHSLKVLPSVCSARVPPKALKPESSNDQGETSRGLPAPAALLLPVGYGQVFVSCKIRASS